MALNVSAVDQVNNALCRSGLVHEKFDGEKFDGEKFDGKVKVARRAA